MHNHANTNMAYADVVIDHMHDDENRNVLTLLGRLRTVQLRVIETSLWHLRHALLGLQCQPDICQDQTACWASWMNIQPTFLVPTQHLTRSVMNREAL